MKISLDCIPCLIRQSIEAARFASSDELFQKQVIENILNLISNMDLEKSPIKIAQTIHGKIKQLTGLSDPYKKVKSEFNALALSMLEELSDRINSSENPLQSAVKIAVAGNVIDSGAKTNLSVTLIRSAIERIFSEPFFGDIDDFCEKAAEAKKIFYLADNAGEIFFDRLLIEKLRHPMLTVCVRGYPIINDATMEDALAAGIDKFAAIIENGSDAPGTLLDECSNEFIQQFTEADLVISKGQGNYETLSDIKKNIFFLFKVKCSIVADHAGLPVGSNAVIRSAQYSAIY